MLKYFWKSNKGFSLVELIVVIVILGILVGIAVPNLLSYINKSRISSDIASAEVVLRTAMTSYADMVSKNVAVDDTSLKADVIKHLNSGVMPTSKVTGKLMYLEYIAPTTASGNNPTFKVRSESITGDVIAPENSADTTKWPRS